jgi:type I restriction enzyme S subunit
MLGTPDGILPDRSNLLRQTRPASLYWFIVAAYVAPAHLCGANLSRGVARIEVSQLLPEFLVAFVQSDAAQQHWKRFRRGSKLNEVSIPTGREFPVPIPPESEQRDILEHIRSFQRTFDSLFRIANCAVERLRQYRSALNTAAVKGQIEARQHGKEAT